MELRPQYCRSLRGGGAATINDSESYEKGIDHVKRRRAPLTLGERDSLLHINENNNTNRSNRSNTHSFTSSIAEPIRSQFTHELTENGFKLIACSLYICHAS